MRDVSVVGAGAMGSALVEVLAGSGAEVMVWNRTATKAFQRLQDADTDDEVGAAWVALDLLRRMYQAPDRDTAHRRLVAFYEWAADVDVDEITRLATTIDTWQDEVLAFFDTRASNAPTESAIIRSPGLGVVDVADEAA
jgi:transposase